MKDKIARWYKLSLWTEAMVQNAARKGVLTDEEVREILEGSYALQKK